MFAELLPLTPLETLICVAIIFISYVIKGLSGFGSGLIAVPLLAFFLPITFIVPLLGLLSYSGTIAQSVQLRRQVEWHDILPLLPFSLAGISLAVWLLVNLDPQSLVRGLALFVVAYSVYALLPIPALRGSRWWAIPAGSLGGIVGALFGTGAVLCDLPETAGSRQESVPRQCCVHFSAGWWFAHYRLCAEWALYCQCLINAADSIASADTGDACR
jgi:hypothetical protein